MRILLTIEYDGTDFCGWQIQPEKRTVQGVLSSALSDLFREKIVLHGSGRTDAGVHALGQKAHFDVKNCPIPVRKIPLAVNVLLPSDVSVVAAVEVDPSFEAQYSAKKKTYRYDIYFSRVNHPLLDRTAAQVACDEIKFDVDLAQSALRQLVGTHDFTAFSSTGRPVKDATRVLYDAHVVKNGDAFSFFVTGNGFLYNMVRIIVGTVVEIGLSLRPLSRIDAAFSTLDRKQCGKTFPARGLTLVSVEYEE